MPDAAHVRDYLCEALARRLVVKAQAIYARVRDPIGVKRDGIPLRVRDMKDQHLDNALKLKIREGEGEEKIVNALCREHVFRKSLRDSDVRGFAVRRCRQLGYTC